MNIYKLERTDTVTWCNYNAVVLYAKSEEDARKMHPSGVTIEKYIKKEAKKNKLTEDEVIKSYLKWTIKPENIKVTLVAKDVEIVKELKPIILADYADG